MAATYCRIPVHTTTITKRSLAGPSFNHGTHVVALTTFFYSIKKSTSQAWAPSAASQLAPQLFALSLFPYLGFLYHLTRSGKVIPKMTVFGFYFLLLFVGATIPAGIYGASEFKIMGLIDLTSV